MELLTALSPKPIFKLTFVSLITDAGLIVIFLLTLTLQVISRSQ